ncbi:MAG: response regulator transcription factor [Piscinibacter sp.]|uniref:response regulator transcription factor n=1 Tax=Piscinibacter sp. TaxID=1903157 RepID=UPI003D150569
MAEDDEALGRATCTFMMRQGHVVDWVTTGNKLLELSGKFEYDCVLLDIGLPELGGQDCLVNLRNRANLTPVVVITAQGFRDQRIQLLDLGADDYLIKPYDLEELLARVKAVVRRSLPPEQAAEDGVTIGPLTLQPGSNSVRWRGNSVVLTAGEYRVLDTLVRRRGGAVSRQQLEAAVYGWNETIGSNTIEVHVHSLRRKLAPELIVTLRGIGYQLGPL